MVLSELESLPGKACRKGSRCARCVDASVARPLASANRNLSRSPPKLVHDRVSIGFPADTPSVSRTLLF